MGAYRVQLGSIGGGLGRSVDYDVRPELHNWYGRHQFLWIPAGSARRYRWLTLAMVTHRSTSQVVLARGMLPVSPSVCGANFKNWLIGTGAVSFLHSASV